MLKRPFYKRAFFWNSIAILLFVIGLLFLLNKPIQNWLVNHLSKKNQIETVTKKEVTKNKKAKVSFNFNEVKQLSMNEILKASMSGESVPVIGAIAIPSVKMNLPIAKGLDNNTLAVAAGTMKEDQKMGEGNYSLAGHHMNREDLLFSPLYNNLKFDADIYLTDKEYIYIYHATRKNYIAATQVDVIDDRKGSKLLTLVTCDATGAGRYIVQGEFDEKIPVEKATKKMRDAFNMKLNNK